ncbi:MAG: TetR/AcrR family transcriptional regulator [Polyangiaceae bacterium]
MARPRGTPNPGHDEARRKLARAVRAGLVRQGADSSLAELARSAGVSIPTLKHYFGDRSGAVAEALRQVREDAAPYTASLTDPGALDLAASLTKVARDLAHAWTTFGVGRLFSVGLGAGFDDPVTGPGYLDGVLEPTVRAVEHRLRIHAERHEVRLAPSDALGLRVAALGFLSPLLVALLHQRSLGGDRCRPLDLAAFSELHVAGFLRAYAAPHKPRA